MNGDILYKEDGFVFSYRTGGILIHDGKILLQKPENDDYSIIGGHVARMETTSDTLRREFFEELHAEVEIERLTAIGEIFFPWGNRSCHQISLYYTVKLTDKTSIPLDGSFRGFDDLGNERINLEFVWIPLEKLREITVYPQELIQHILSGEKTIFHFTSDQLN